MDRVKKGRLAQRAKSFKEDIIDILSNLRPPTNGAQGNTKPRVLPTSNQHQNGNDKEEKELLCVIENLPQNIALNQHFTSEINKNILQVKYALKFYKDVIMKNTLELVPGSASVVLETVYNILTTLGNVFPAGEHSSSLISATNLVHQALSQLLKWSDDILLQVTTNPENNITTETSEVLHSGVKSVVDALQIAVNDLVQIVIHKAANKLPPPSTNPPASPALYESSLALLNHKDIVDSLPPPSSPNRASKSSEGSLLEDLPGSADWSSDSLQEENDSPPPKPPLPLKGFLTDFGDIANLSIDDPSTPPPLPPKKRSLVGGLSPMPGLSPIAGVPPSGNALSPFSPGWKTPLTLPDLVPSNPWLNESFDSGTHGSAVSMFDRQHLENRWDSEQTKNVSMTNSHTSVFSSSSSSSFASFTAQQSSSAFHSHSANASTSSFSSFAAQQQSSSMAYQSKSARASSTSFTSYNSQHQSSKATYQASSCNNSSYSAFNSQHSSSSSSSTIQTSVSANEDHMDHLSVPPALPAKRRQRAMNRLPSQYDNVDQFDCSITQDSSSLADFMAVKQKEASEVFHFSEEKRVQSSSTLSTSNAYMRHELSASHAEQFVSVSRNGDDSEGAPPLPPKKRHIKAYMEMVGSYSQPSEVELFRQTMEVYNYRAAQWAKNNEELFKVRASSYLAAPPPLLPPKKAKQSITIGSGSGSLEPQAAAGTRVSGRESLSSPPASPSPLPGSCSVPAILNGSEKTDQTAEVDAGMEQVDLSGDLVLKQPEDEGPEVRGGGLDALITHAAKLNKDDYLYQVAFLTTYRTFITPLELTRKLIHRFHFFLRKSDMTNQRVARNAFSLLVGVIDDLALSELEEKLMRQIIDFQSRLIASGDLVLAKALRKKFLEKCTARKLRNLIQAPPQALADLGVTLKQNQLLDFKSSELAEQMTLLDAELFMRIEIPEVLVWAQEQNEEKSPNLTLFTEHFNKMSYWARSRILEQAEAKDRERYVLKFIKIMKHLRRLNNFNSYLALLSALDSAPVRRLEWQKSITDGLQEYCALIDSSSSFRAYRQALADTKPPCIPYIGLILQDLTFVHIGNSDTLSDGRINFSKRWQQFHILENMKRFHKCQYPFKRNDRIVAFFNDFNDFLCEEMMWQISETIRPRGSNNSSNSGKK